MGSSKYPEFRITRHQHQCSRTARPPNGSDDTPEPPDVAQWLEPRIHHFPLLHFTPNRRTNAAFFPSFAKAKCQPLLRAGSGRMAMRHDVCRCSAKPCIWLRHGDHAIRVP